jgi:hypothetical protein
MVEYLETSIAVEARVFALELGHVLQCPTQPIDSLRLRSQELNGLYHMQTQAMELEACLERARKALQDFNERWRHLHHERRTLKTRITALKQSILLSTQSPSPTGSSLQATCLAKSAVESTSVGAVQEGSQLPARPRQVFDQRMQSQHVLHHLVVKGPTNSRYNQYSTEPPRKPMSAFRHHAVVSFSALGKYMTSHQLRSSPHATHQELRQAILMFQSETAQMLNVPTSGICWFVEWPYEARAQQRMCTSFSAWSGGCRLSAMVAHIALTLECMFLVLEHEHLSSIADPLFKAPKHPILDAAEPPLPPRPQPPDAVVLAAASVRCGLKNCVQLESAMRRILLPLARQFRALLPQSKWLAACVQMMRVAKIAVYALGSTPNANLQQSRMHTTESSSDQGAESCIEV